jgi:hypothetical protein
MLTLVNKLIKISPNFRMLITVSLLLLVSINPIAMAIIKTPQIEWQRTFGNFAGYCITQTNDDGYAITGVNATYSFEKYRGYGDYYPLLVKTNSNGEVLWAKTYGPDNGINGYAYSIIQTKDLGYLLSGNNAKWLFKVDCDGNIQWNLNFEITLKCQVIQTVDENYLLAGSFYNDTTATNEAIILKIDTNGNVLWNQTFNPGDSKASWIRGIIETEDGNYVMVGTWDMNFWLSKIDKEGNLLANKTYNYGDPIKNGLTFNSISRTSDRKYLLAGNGAGNGWLFKVDSNGEEQWHQSYSMGNTYTDFYSVAETTDGGFIAGGNFNSSALLLKTDAYGSAQWNKTYSGGLIRSVISINNGFVVTGMLNNNVWLAKFTIEANTSRCPFAAVPDSAYLLIIFIIIATIVIIAIVAIQKKRWGFEPTKLEISHH